MSDTWIDLPSVPTVTPIVGTVTVLQGTIPWDDNISQFGGNNVVTGTGASGLGIPRVTVSNDSNILATQSGTWTVQQGSPPWSVSQSGSWTVTALQGTSPWLTSRNWTLSNSTDSVAAVQSGTWTTGRTWTLSNSTDSIAAVQSGTWNIGTLTTITNPVTVNQGTNPWVISGSTTVTGTVTALQGTSPWVVSGTVAATQSGTWSTGRTWTLASGTDSVSAVQSGTWNIGTLTSITNPVTVNQGTSPWITSGTATVSGTVTANQGTSPWIISGTVLASNFPTTVDTNYGTVGANTLRSAAQIGNATGAAAFNAGTTTAQTLRVVLPTDQTAIPVSQSGTWTTGRTWSLSSGTDSISSVQSGAWTVSATQGTSPWVTSRNWTLSSGTDSVAAVQSGTWNINNITGTITLPTLAATSTKQSDGSQKTQIVDGAGTVIGAAQTISGTNYLPVVQASSATPGSAVVARSTQIAGSDGTNARTILTDTSGNMQVVGNVASGSADSGNPIKIGGVFNTTAPTVTSGNRNNIQLDNKSSVYVNREGRRRTYSAAVNGLTVAANPTDILTITGAASTTVRIKKIEFSCSSTNNLVTPMLLIKRSTANTGGTSTAVTAVPHDSGDAAASATVLSYTANPTLGTTVGTIRTTRFQTSGANTVVPSVLPWEFERTSKPPTLLSTSEVLALNLNANSIAGSLFNIYIEWTEE